jgi:hypothetical protein
MIKCQNPHRFMEWKSEKVIPRPTALRAVGKKSFLKKTNFFIKNKKFQKIIKIKIYYAKWTLRIEVVYGKNNIYYCNFRVYFVTGPIEGR